MCFAQRQMLCLMMACSAFPALAGDGVVSDGLLSDQQLYHAMACGATPQGQCQGPLVRWNKAEVRVVFSCDPAAYPNDLATAAAIALDQAIESLNRAGSGLTLRLETDAPDVLVLCTTLAEGALTKTIPNMTDGQIIGEAYTQINWDADENLSSATIILSNTITPDVLRSVMLEELFQSLGFPYDIENAAYEGVSILSQTSDVTTSITGQDANVLRLHYPPN